MSDPVRDLVLALDTATSVVAVALVRGGAVLAERSVHDAQRHAEVLAPAIESVVRDADSSLAEVNDIVVGTGPGPFTGLRVGVITATTLGFALRVPVHGVCSLDALAHAYAAGPAPATEFVVATDARRKEVYWARYRIERGVPQRLSGPAVDRPAYLPGHVATLPVIGRGAQLYPDAFGPLAGQVEMSAAALAAVARRRLAAGESLPVTPRYLRRPDVREPGSPKSTLLPERAR